MKKTQIIELYSNIKKTFITFLSIGVIVALGVGLFLGINFASQGLLDTNDKRYQKEKFRDFEAVSVFGFTDEDVMEVEKLSNVEVAVGQYAVSGSASFGTQQRNVKIMSQSEGVNEGSIISGRFPEQTAECAVESGFAKKHSIKPGDILVLKAIKGQKNYLTTASYTVTGTMNYAGGDDKNGNILLNEKGFNTESFEQCYTSILIRLEGSGSLHMYSKEYEKLVNHAIDPIQNVVNERTTLRYQSIKEKAEKGILEAGKKGDEIEPAVCIVYPRAVLPISYKPVKINADNLAALGLTFALTFIIIAILVCYSSISRVVEEQRTLIGVQKAQGFFASEIRIRYLLYAIISAMLGIITGVIGAYFIIQRIILNIYKVLDNFQKMEKTFLVPITIVVCCCTIMVTLISAWSACNQLLKTPSTELMRERVPVHRKYIWCRFKCWKKLSLSTRFIIGNVLLEKRRAVTTIIGTSGCTILLVIGFSLKISAGQAPDIQYDSIIKYDSVLSVNRSMEKQDEEAVEEQLKEAGCEYTFIASEFKTHIQGNDFNPILMVCAGEKELKGYIGIRDYLTGQELAIPREGILLSQGTADAYGLGVGDVLVTMDNRGNKYELKISGIFENYIEQMIITSPSYYEKVYGEKLLPNQYYIQLQGADEVQLRETLFLIDGVEGLEPSNMGEAELEKVTGPIDGILVMFIVLAAIMAFMILLNLAAMHIRKKSRELTVMRVNGFTVGEVKRYLQRETIVLTGVGIIIGIALGVILSEQIKGMISNQILQLKGGIQPAACLIPAMITMLFSILINEIAMRKIKKLKLNNVDAN